MKTQIIYLRQHFIVEIEYVYKVDLNVYFIEKSKYRNKYSIIENQFIKTISLSLSRVIVISAFS